MKVNATMIKFGYPETVIKEFDRWVVLLRPQQITLGSLVLACKEAANTFSSVSAQGFEELREITAQVERGLKGAFGYDKINYLMLMMVDPDVHFHVVPRYGRELAFQGRIFHDHGWPGPPDFSRANWTDPETNQAVLAYMKPYF